MIKKPLKNMSGHQRRVSRNLIDASAAISPGTGSHAHFRQPENELKLKLDAIDTSFKISNKKLKNETRELRQILFDLQRDLKSSKSVSEYVPSFEEEKGKNRQRRVTVATGPQELGGHESERSLLSDLKVNNRTTKRPRKISGSLPVHPPKLLIHDNDVVTDGRNEVIKNDGIDFNDETKYTFKEGSTKECSHPTTSRGQQDSLFDDKGFLSDNKDVLRKRELTEKYLKSFDKQEESSNQSSLSLFSISNSDAKIIDPPHPPASYGLQYSKHFNEDRKRSLSDSDATYRDVFTGRFVTQSLHEKLHHQCRIDDQSQATQKRTRRVTVSGPPPTGVRRMIDIGDISLSPFQSGSKQKRSEGRSPTGSIQPKDDGDFKDDIFDAISSRHTLPVGRIHDRKLR